MSSDQMEDFLKHCCQVDLGTIRAVQESSSKQFLFNTQGDTSAPLLNMANKAYIGWCGVDDDDVSGLEHFWPWVSPEEAIHKIVLHVEFQISIPDDAAK